MLMVQHAEIFKSTQYGIFYFIFVHIQDNIFMNSVLRISCCSSSV